LYPFHPTPRPLFPDAKKPAKIALYTHFPPQDFAPRSPKIVA
jgi:hypothetical protein